MEAAQDTLPKKNINKVDFKESKYATGRRKKSIARVWLKKGTGNFYVNDKSTGSIVGQQPFGGSGKSGTNDKAGDLNLLFRLFNQRNIKINYGL